MRNEKIATLVANVAMVIAIFCLSLSATDQTLQAEELSAKDKASAEATLAFLATCAASLPNMPADAKGFKKFGYDQPTSDPHVFAKKGGGYAGIGIAGIEGDETTKKPNGCLVYIKDLDSEKIAGGIDSNLDRFFKNVGRRQDGKDYYWLLADFQPRKFIMFVAPKNQRHLCRPHPHDDFGVLE